MKNDRETRLSNMLNVLKFLHHLHEARFFSVCMSEADLIPPSYSNAYFAQLTWLIRRGEMEYMWLNEDIRLSMPGDITQDDTQQIDELITKVEASLAKLQKARTAAARKNPASGNSRG